MGMSQEEIDRLVAEGGQEGEEAGSRSPTAERPGKQLNALERAVELFSEAVKNILPILVGAAEVEVSLETPQEASLASLLAGLAEDAVCFSFKEATLADGLLVGAIDVPLALEVSQKMMGQEGEEALNEALLSALSEAFNNVLGAFDTSVTEELGEEVEHADLKFLDGDPREVVPSEAGLDPDVPAVLSAFTVKLDGKSGRIGILLSANQVASIRAKFPPPAEQKAPPKPARKAKVEPEGVATPKAPDEPPAERPGVAAARFEQLAPRQPSGESRGIELVLDVPLSVSVELGRKTLSLRDILSLVPGSLVELDKLAGEAVDLLVNGKLFARGEVVTIDENFGVRISSIVTPRERVERLR